MGTIARRDHADPTAFKRRVTRWAARMGVRTERVYIQNMRNKWASCSTSGRLYFSTDVLREPRDFQDTVIAHELLHLLGKSLKVVGLEQRVVPERFLAVFFIDRFDPHRRRPVGHCFLQPVF